MSSIYVNKSLGFEIEDFEKRIEEFLDIKNNFKQSYDSLEAFSNDLSEYGFDLYMNIDGLRLSFVDDDVPLVYYVDAIDDGMRMCIQIDIGFESFNSNAGFCSSIPPTTILKYELPDELRTKINDMIK